MDRAYEEKLFHSCRILFGPGIDIGWDFLFFVQAAGIKSAYRKKALLTHPDRAPIRIGENEAHLNRRFIETKDACDHLLDFVRLRHTLVRPPRPGRGSRGRGTAPHAPRDARRKRRREYYYHHSLPRRRLLVGEFLFYSGAVSWEALIKAIVWQRRQRPRLGEMALRRGWLSTFQVRDLVRRKRLGVPIGEAFVRRGFLSRRQLELLILEQRRLQRALGEYFVETGRLTRKGLEGLLGEREDHNGAFPDSFPFRSRQGREG